MEDDQVAGKNEGEYQQQKTVVSGNQPGHHLDRTKQLNERCEPQGYRDVSDERKVHTRAMDKCRQGLCDTPCTEEQQQEYTSPTGEKEKVMDQYAEEIAGHVSNNGTDKSRK